MQGDYWIVNSEHAKNRFMAHLEQLWATEKWLRIQIQLGKCTSGNECDIDVIDKDGTLGVEFRMLGEFMPVTEFVSVAVMKV